MLVLRFFFFFKIKNVSRVELMLCGSSNSDRVPHVIVTLDAISSFSIYFNK